MNGIITAKMIITAMGVLLVMSAALTLGRIWGTLPREAMVFASIVEALGAAGWLSLLIFMWTRR